MHRRLAQAGLALAAVVAVACSSGQPAAQPAQAAAEQPQRLPTETLTIHTQAGPVRLTVQVADNDATREKGLMFVRSMPENEGMIFDFHSSQAVSFWMHNTYIPLDLLFVAADGRILTIARNARPLDDGLIPSGGRIRAVIEINGGVADKLGVKVGDQVTDEQVFPAH